MGPTAGSLDLCQFWYGRVWDNMDVGMEGLIGMGPFRCGWRCWTGVLACGKLGIYTGMIGHGCVWERSIVGLTGFGCHDCAGIFRCDDPALLGR